jgi:2-aminomuconate deaminase
MSGNSVRTDNAPAPVGAYPHARRVGDLLFLSGVGPRQPGSDAIPGNVHDADGRLVGYDI